MALTEDDRTCGQRNLPGFDRRQPCEWRGLRRHGKDSASESVRDLRGDEWDRDDCKRKYHDIAATCTTNADRFVYVANGGSNSISAYAINAASGALTAIGGSPFPAGNVPYAIAVDPSGSSPMSRTKVAVTFPHSLSTVRAER